MLTIVDLPQPVSLSGNPVKATVSTTGRYITTPMFSMLAFAFADTVITDGNTISLSFKDEDNVIHDIVYTCNSVPTNEREFSSLDNLYSKMLIDIELNRYYIVSRLENQQIFIKARVHKPCFDLTFASTVTGYNLNNYTYSAGSEKQFFQVGCNVWVKNLTGTGAPGLSLAAQLFASPNDNNKAVFEVSEFIRNQYNYEFSYPDALPITIRNQMRTDYKLEFFEKYFSEGDEIRENFIQSPIRYALHGGLSEEILTVYSQLSTNWWEQYQANKSFLTWQPQMKPVFADQPERLYMICYAENLSVRLRATFYYTDNSNFTTDITQPLDVKIYDVLEIDASYQVIASFINTFKMLKYFELFIDTPNQSATERKSYTLETRHFNQRRTFMFRNSLGAYDCISLAGIFSQDNKYGRNMVQIENYYKEQGVELQKTYSGNSQYLPSKEFKLWLQEFYTSPEICELDGSAVYGILLLDEKQKVWQDRRNMHDISFEYIRTIIDNLFTPLEITISFDGLAYSDEGFVSSAEGEIVGV